VAGITTTCLNVLSANVAGSALPAFIGIGTSDTAFTSGDTSLAAETDRNQINTTDLSTIEQVTLISNFSPPEISGTTVKEYGTFTTGSSMMNREVLTGSLVMDGTNELQIQQTFKFFR